MIATTIISSIKVKPVCLLCIMNLSVIMYLPVLAGLPPVTATK
jgi:hypothetical protein